MKSFCTLLFLSLTVLSVTCNVSLAAATFDDLALAPNSYWNGSDGSGGFTSGSVQFSNSFSDWGGGSTSWSGFAYSNVNDTTTSGYGNQYAAYTGTGFGGSGNYAIGYVPLDWITYAPIPIVATLQTPSTLETVKVSNTTYTALTMKNGDGLGFSKKFGGESGNDPDWFKLTIAGKDTDGNVTGTVDFFLADYRSENKYIHDTWQTVDLSSLGTVKALEFTLSSSDTGSFGMNTPGYFALDTLVIPEPLTLSLLVTGFLGLISNRRKGA